MARWYKLEKTAPLKTKHGCIDKVLHIWPHRPPPDGVLARELGRQLALLFKEELFSLMAKKNRAASANTPDPESDLPKLRKKRRRKRGDDQ